MLLACRGGEPGAPARPPAAPPPELPTAPPAGAIRRVAITEAGDAAITADDGGGWRLWPALDGTRPPVVLHAGAPRRVVLAREADGEGLVAGILDPAGAIELVRTTRDGALVGRASLPVEPGFDDLVALAGGILALGRDQVVTWYDAQGAARGSLAPLPGELLVELAARRGAAIAGIGGIARAVAGVRLLALDRGALRWGAYTHLPDPLRGLALSPDHRRIAGIRADLGVGQVIELGGPRIAEDGLDTEQDDEPAAIGFLASGRVAFATSTMVRRAAGDVVRSGPDAATSPPAFGGELVVLGRGDALALVGRSRVLQLGYRELGVGPVLPAGAQLAMEAGHQLLWLDGRLAAGRMTDERGPHERLALDERLFVELVREPRTDGKDDAGPTEVAIRDPDAGTTASLGTWPRVDDVKFDPRSRTLAISAGREAHRFFVGAHGRSRPLPDLALAFEHASVYPVDPRVAHGIVAVAIRASRERARPELAIETHREQGVALRSGAAGRLLGVDETAAVWLADGSTVTALRDGEPQVRAELDPGAPIEDGAPARDGAFVAVHRAHEVIAIEARGAVRWRREVLQVQQLAISGDGRTVAVATPTGLVALDAATGERRAWACGWHFGLHEVLGERSGATCRPD